MFTQEVLKFAKLRPLQPLILNLKLKVYLFIFKKSSISLYKALYWYLL